MSTFEFEPVRLRIARELAKLSQTQLASKVDLTPPAISQFESGAARPSPHTIEQLGRILGVPSAFFMQPVVETHEGFFRSLRRTAVAERRKARAIAHVAHDLARDAHAAGHFPHNTVTTVDAISLDSPREQIELAAARIRSAWNIGAGPIPSVVGLLEHHGVVVIRLPLGTADVDAFSLPFPDHPVVVLSSDKNDRARSRFDAAHELAHLAIHGETIWGVKEVETQAHQFAAAFLMPANEIADQLPTTVDWARLFDLKRYWQVSLAALLMRARTLGRMTENTYLTAMKTAAVRGWRRIEPVPLGSPEQPREVLAFLASHASKPALARLPRDLVRAIAEATQ